MNRRTFADVLKSVKINIDLEYAKLYNMYYGNNLDDKSSLRTLCGTNFTRYPFRGTFLSLDEFDAVTDYCLFFHKKSVDLTDFIRFCEYTINLISPLSTDNLSHTDYFVPPHRRTEIELYIQNVYIIIEKIGYMKAFDEEFHVIIFVPKSPEAIAVAEIIEPTLSYKTIEYNHYSMKGNLNKKKEIILKYADLLEARRQNLKSINSSLEQDVFSLLNNINIRHNNIDPKSSSYHKYIADMSNDELEKWYDETYQVCLLCFLELDNIERKKKIKELNENIKNANKQN